jgi:hypothetical protein
MLAFSKANWKNLTILDLGNLFFIQEIMALEIRDANIFPEYLSSASCS